MERVTTVLKGHRLLTGIVVGAALLFLLLWLVDWNTLVSLLRGIVWERVLFAVPFLLASFLLLITGWRYLLPLQLAWSETFVVTSVSFALSILTPFPDSALRIITTEGGTDASLTQATVALAMERLLALIMRLLAFIILLYVWPWEWAGSTTVSVSRIVLTIAAVAAVVWIVRHPKAVLARVSRLSGLPYVQNFHVEEKVTNLATNLTQTFTVRRFLRMLMLFLLISLASATFHLLVLSALPIRLSPRTMAAVALSLLVILPPMVPRMIGVYQTVAIALLASLRLLDVEQATAYAVLVQLPQLILWTLLGALSYRRSRLRIGTLTAKVRRLLQSRGSPQVGTP